MALAPGSGVDAENWRREAMEYTLSTLPPERTELPWWLKAFLVLWLIMVFLDTRKPWNGG